MPKTHIDLSIDSDVYVIAKTLRINLSNEFEQWIRIRTNTYEEKTEIQNIDVEIAKRQAEIEELKRKDEMLKSKQQQEKDEQESLSRVIDNMITAHEDKEINWQTHIQMSASGVQLLYKRRFNRYITFKEAVELLEAKLKEKGIKWQI
jgi:FtsZ-binding cell division protein ZapB